MKTLKLMTVQGYLVAVSDATPNEGALVVHEDENGCHELMYCNNRTGHGLKIEGYLPLKENLPPLKGIDFLPPLEQEDDVEKLAREYCQRVKKEIENQSQHIRIGILGGSEIGFIKGYNKAKEKYKYTEEDIDKAIDMSRETKNINPSYDNNMWVDKFSIDEIIQSLSQPKMPIAFECEVEELFAEDGKTKIGEDLAVEIIEGFTAYLSGKYIYQ